MHRFKRFPINGKTLKPLFAHWPKLATDDPSRLAVWQQEYPKCAWGIATEPSGLIVVDLDRKNGHDGLSEWRRLVKEHGGVPKTLRVRTKSNGYHIYFYGQSRSSTGRLAPGVDIKSVGGFVVAPGTPNYEIISRDENKIAQAPEWLIEAALPPRPKPGCSTDDPNDLIDLPPNMIDLPADIELARIELEKTPLPVQGERSSGLFKIAARMREHGLSPGMICSMLTPWVEKHGLDPGDKIRSIVSNVFRYASGDMGSASVAVFPDLETERILNMDPPDTLPSNDIPFGNILREMNEEWACVMGGGKFLIYRLEHNPATNMRAWKAYDKSSFEMLYSNRSIETGKPAGPGRPPSKSKSDPLLNSTGRWWLRHPMRRQYPDGMLFLPCQDAPDTVLNIWQGWGVQPDPNASWDMLKDHIWRNIAQRHKDWYDFLIRWMAYMIQKPSEICGVAVILRGVEGVGKSYLGECLCALCGSHAAPISGRKRLTSNFNALLEDKIFILANETIWAGDHEGNDILLDILTNPFLGVEPKGVDVRLVKNYLHVMVTTNHDHIVRASATARRYAVFDVIDSNRNDWGFWTPLRDQMEKQGGLGAMLHELQTLKLGSWTPRAHIPDTPALRDQIVASRAPEEEFWASYVQDGALPERWIANTDDRDWRIRPIDVVQAYVMDAFRVAYPRDRFMTQAKMGLFLKNRFGAKETRVGSAGSGRLRCWQIPPLRDPMYDWLRQ